MGYSVGLPLQQTGTALHCPPRLQTCIGRMGWGSSLLMGSHLPWYHHEAAKKSQSYLLSGMCQNHFAQVSSHVNNPMTRLIRNSKHMPITTYPESFWYMNQIVGGAGKKQADVKANLDFSLLELWLCSDYMSAPNHMHAWLKFPMSHKKPTFSQLMPESQTRVPIPAFYKLKELHIPFNMSSRASSLITASKVLKWLQWHG